MIDLILSPTDEGRTCTVCGKNATDIQCESCEPVHPICRECVAAHRDDFNTVLG